MECILFQVTDNPKCPRILTFLPWCVGIESCHSDNDCHDGKKCCLDNCRGHRCTDPVY